MKWAKNTKPKICVKSKAPQTLRAKNLCVETDQTQNSTDVLAQRSIPVEFQFFEGSAQGKQRGSLRISVQSEGRRSKSGKNAESFKNKQANQNRREMERKKSKKQRQKQQQRKAKQEGWMKYICTYNM